jgi:t-SNARE complex subunit (syntaxin)
MSGWGDTSGYGARPARTRTAGNTQAAAPAAGATAATPMNSLDDISRNVQKFSGKVVKVENMSQTIGSAQDSREFRSLFEKERGTAQQIAKEVSSALQSYKCTASDKQQFDRVRAQFNTVLQKFESVNRATQRKEREVVTQMSQSVAGGSKSPIGGKNDDLDDVDLEFGAQNQKQRRGGKEASESAQIDHEIIRQQNEELKNLERDLTELSSMYVDMAVLVNEQQKDIDLIEANVAKTATKVEAGVEELKKARKEQKKGRKLKFIIIGIIVVVAVVAVSLGVGIGTKK